MKFKLGDIVVINSNTRLTYGLIGHVVDYEDYRSINGIVTKSAVVKLNESGDLGGVKCLYLDQDLRRATEHEEFLYYMFGVRSMEEIDDH